VSGTNDGRTASAAWTDGRRMIAVARSEDGRTMAATVTDDGRTTPDTRTGLGNSRPVKQVAASLSGKTRRSNSELYRWLWEHYEQLETVREGRPDWIGASEQLTGLGLTGRNGTPLRPDNVRRVWARVVRDRLGLARSAPSPTPVFPAESAPPPLPSPTITAEPIAFEFRTLRRAPLKKQE
jgi:hypothetical protein